MTMSRTLFFFLILAVSIIALIFRVSLLSERPMHGDEAVNAVKVAELIEGGGYKYDPYEYHGPSLNYFILIGSWFFGVDSIVDLNEQFLRLLPVVFGFFLLFLVCMLRGALGRDAILFSIVLIAVSPAMVFYSRYFIHELILVFFTMTFIIGGYFYFKSPKVYWVLLVGVSLGLMHATKETFVIALGSIGLGLLLLCAQSNKKQRLDFLKRISIVHLFLALVTAAVVSIVFFSSFFSNPKGVVDSISTFSTYADRAENSIHTHPWYFYFKLLFFYSFSDGPFFSEWVVLFLSLVGIVFAFKKGGEIGDPLFIRFIAYFTISMIAVYSILPYKTPWCLLGFYCGMLLLSGVGAAQLIRLKSRALRLISIVIIFLGVLHLGQQAYYLNYKYFFDSRNPHVYGHTSLDVPKIVDKIKLMASVGSDNKPLRIQVYCPESDYWPLPWYLRGYQVEYGDAVSKDTPPAPIILIQPSMEDALMHKLYELPPPGQRELYMHLFYDVDDGTVDIMELRPSVELVGFVSRSLFEKYLQKDIKKLEGGP
ncbi:MAG: hypothetical protein CMO44_15490 [Verrucomicrobiales bacterium]|nr:hypothetical protein [Verrucomicrobiales bacterium]